MIQIFNLDKMFITFLSIIFISRSASPSELKYPRCVRQARQPCKILILENSYVDGRIFETGHSKSGYFSLILNGPERTQWSSLWLICEFLAWFLSHCSKTGPLCHTFKHDLDAIQIPNFWQPDSLGPFKKPTCWIHSRVWFSNLEENTKHHFIG